MKKLVFILLVLLTPFLYAEDNSTPAQVDERMQKIYEALIEGPKEIPILQQATLHLPEKFGYIPKKESMQLLKSMGNGNNPEVEGIILSLESINSGFFVVSYRKSGYIRDDDAKDWNADDLLKSLKKGAELMNKERKAMGIPELEVVGWISQPWYDNLSHQLIWSAEVKDKIEIEGDVNGINYNTYVLGREGYISLNLVTDKNQIEMLKPTAKMLLSAMSFNEGKRYSDFNEATDHVAEYGLAALVAGVAAKKLGIFALIAAFFIKFWKLAGIALAGLWYTLKGRKPKEEEELATQEATNNKHSVVFKSKK